MAFLGNEFLACKKGSLGNFGAGKPVVSAAQADQIRRTIAQLKANVSTARRQVKDALNQVSTARLK